MEDNRHQCVFNKMVDCSEHICQNCGWKPEVAAQRLQEWADKRAGNKP